MTSTPQTRITTAGGFALLTLTVFVLLVSIAQAAQPLTQLQRAHDGAAVTYAGGPLTQLQRAHDGAAVTYAAAPLTQLQRAHDGEAVTYAAAGPTGSGITAGSGSFLIGGIAVTVFVIALVAFLALGNRARRRGESAPVTSIAQSPSASPAAQHDERERKAA